MIVFHGSDHIIENPVFRGGKRNNDYGYGFYTTRSADLTKEWACAQNTDGFANRYDLDTDGLKVLNLNDPEYSILNWLAVLTKYRTYWQKGSIAEEAKAYLQDRFFVDPEAFDIVIGYRADDSYFTFAQDFVAGTISLQKLNEAMHLGELGEQIVLKSRLSYEHIKFLNAEPAIASIYYDKKTARDRDARREYRRTRRKADSISELYMLDIMREGIENGDPRLR